MDRIKIVVQAIKVLAWGLFLSIAVLHGQSKSKNEINLDPSIRHDTLDNGFTYYIKNIEKPNSKLSMYFYVKVGSYHNNSQQLDYAHAIEHLAFRCAKHFKDKHIANDSELLGKLHMKRGDISAQTAHLYTRYSFNIPTMNLDALNTGFLFFRDIADGLEFDEKDINSERGPLRQELIYRSGDHLDSFFLEKKLRNNIFPCVEDFTKFFERNKAFSSESITAFYKNWYRPSLMSLVIIGNIPDIKKLEVKIRKRFSDIPIHDLPLSMKNCYDEYFNSPNKFVLIEREKSMEPDSNADQVKIRLYQRDKRVLSSSGPSDGFKRKIIWSVFTKMLNKRLNLINEDYITIYGASAFPPTRMFPAFRIKVWTQMKQNKEAIISTMRALKQIREHGFTSNEWLLAKKEYLKLVEQKNDTSKISYWNEHIKDFFLYDQAVPYHKATKVNRWFMSLSLEEFNILARDFALFNPQDIAVIAPESSRRLHLTERKIRENITYVKREPVEEFIFPVTPKNIISTKELSNLKKLNYIDTGKNSFGASKLILGNGVRVILKPQDPTYGRLKDRILLHGFSPRGASCFPKQQYFSAINAPNIIRLSGIKEMNMFTLDRLLQQTSLNQGVHLYVKSNESGIKCNSTLEDLDKMLQLVYLYFTNPRKDPIAFQYWKKHEIKRHISPTYNSLIQEDFNVKIRQFLGDSTNIPEGTFRLKGIQKTELNSAYEIFKNLFGNSKNFTFLITGNFTPKEIIPLIQKYLGNLPTDPSLSTCQLSSLNNIEAQNRPLYHEFSAKDIGASYDMKSKKYSMRFITKTNSTHDWKEDIKVKLLGLLIHSKIQELRFSKDASLYQMGAFGRYVQYLNSYEIGLLLDCVPEEVESLRTECKNMIDQIVKSGFRKQRFQVVIDQFIKSKYAQKSRSNQQAIQSMYNYYRFNIPWVDIEEKKYFVRSLTPKVIQKTAQNYLKTENRMEFILK